MRPWTQGRPPAAAGTRARARRIRPAYILAGATLIFGLWLVSFVANLMRHWNFSCTKASGLFVIRSGKGAKRRHVLRKRRINYIDYRQSLLMKLFKVTTVEVGCSGYGKRHREISAIIPITTNSRIEGVSRRGFLGGLAAFSGAVAMGAAGKSPQSCPILCDPTDCSLPGSSVHGTDVHWILQERILEWIAMPSSRRSF